MTNTAPKQRTLELLRDMPGEGADFRPGQWEVIETVVIHKTHKPRHNINNYS